MKKVENVLLILRHTKKQLKNDIKYNGIINAFKRKGYCVWTTYSDGSDIYISDGEISEKIGVLNTKIQSISRNTALYKAVYNYMKNTDKVFKYCYIRSMPAFLGYKKMLKKIGSKGTKIAVEIPTYPDTGEIESQTFINRILLRLLKSWEKNAAKYIDVYLPMGEYAKEINGRPAVNIENGVEADFLNKREYKPVNPGEIHMLAVAKIARWHGYDRVIEGMKLYYEKNPEIKVYFHLVGPDGDGTLAEYKKKIEEYKLQEYVLLEGPKYGEEADSYFNMADVGIASVNIQGMKTVYPLKIVEYLARGIPFIYAGLQANVNQEWGFAMSVPIEDSPINIENIVEFSKRANSISDVSDKMREIAYKDCSWDKQLEKMFDYFEKR